MPSTSAYTISCFRHNLEDVTSSNWKWSEKIIVIQLLMKWNTIYEITRTKTRNVISSIGKAVNFELISNGYIFGRNRDGNRWHFWNNSDNLACYFIILLFWCDQYLIFLLILEIFIFLPSFHLSSYFCFRTL